MSISNNKVLIISENCPGSGINHSAYYLRSFLESEGISSELIFTRYPYDLRPIIDEIEKRDFSDFNIIVHESYHLTVNFLKKRFNCHAAYFTLGKGFDYERLQWALEKYEFIISPNVEMKEYTPKTSKFLKWGYGFPFNNVSSVKDKIEDKFNDRVSFFGRIIKEKIDIDFVKGLSCNVDIYGDAQDESFLQTLNSLDHVTIYPA